MKRCLVDMPGTHPEVSVDSLLSSENEARDLLCASFKFSRLKKRSSSFGMLLYLCVYILVKKIFSPCLSLLDFSKSVAI